MGELNTELSPAGRKGVRGFVYGSASSSRRPGGADGSRTPHAPLVLRAAEPSDGHQPRLQKMLKRNDEKSCFMFLLPESSSVLGGKS